jgi:hypothetical protein
MNRESFQRYNMVGIAEVIIPYFVSLYFCAWSYH